MLPKNVLKNIIKNLSNLHSLLLFDIIIFYSKNDSKVDDFKFSKNLKKLEWENCGQNEVSSTDYLRVKDLKVFALFNNQNMDISLNLVNTLKHLYWHSEVDDNQLFDEIISNNPKLTSLDATSRLLNANNFYHISNNSNLTKLSITHDGFHLDFDSTRLLNLSNIKTLKLYRLYDKDCTIIDIIIENCNNLEELNIDYYVGFERSLKHFINVLTRLKILSIYNNEYSLAKVYTALRHSNLEQLKVGSRNPIKFKSNNFNNFNRMKKLKFIENYHLKTIKIPKYDELDNWRIIKYPKSTQYWKINS
ncbi:hypothetical protein CONCODRAFT_78593 [Conidiobolus coronatus NRRL 28638]|uniref:RNI-like protein n=1 Tax=Conidiobolus coronatus (strain ATCC 28846 / CBS 209.66 / NRRL 28638) TaxID=796925 RepID=A0A137P7H9_CONC2|nr:hypothetical protein CONCODRAFT_78593 [Conidiobolus coronatus NRRL 28638]|eukprot:KXN70960.1 hypothetical protein CONCODRAFT_78593 [Conidiobolus coronatus NRRL 28638]